MKEVTLLGLLVCTTLVSALPYFPYSDNKDDTKYTEWSKEAVAAFLRNKIEEQKFRPESFSEYILTLIQGKKPPPSDDTNTTTDDKKDEPIGPCVDGGGTYSLQREQLQTILDTVHPISGNPTPYTTIITPDHGANMYVNDISPLTAYQTMLSEVRDTTNIWANYSPCPTCVNALINKYKPDNTKPTIHVAGIYTASNSVSHIIESLQCLGKLEHEGFNVEPWNFNEFKAPDGVPVFLDTCISDIDTYYAHSNFTSAYMELERHVNFVQDIGENSHASSWCTV